LAALRQPGACMEAGTHVGLRIGGGEGGPAGIRKSSLEVSMELHTVVALLMVLCNKVP